MNHQYPRGKGFLDSKIEIMTQQNVEQWALKCNLDVREMKPWHFRLMDSMGNLILDVYFKKGQKHNRVFKHRNQKWGIAYSYGDLLMWIK